MLTTTIFVRMPLCVAVFWVCARPVEQSMKITKVDCISAITPFLFLRLPWSIKADFLKEKKWQHIRFLIPCTRQISSPESSSRTEFISLLQFELQQRWVDSLFHQACRFLLLRLLLPLFLLLFFLSWHTIPPRVSIADTLPTFRQLLLLNAVVDPIDLQAFRQSLLVHCPCEKNAYLQTPPQINTNTNAHWQTNEERWTLVHTTTDTQTTHKGRHHRPRKAAVACLDWAGQMSIHENTHPQTQKQKQKHKDKHKSTIAIKQRKKNAQATTESEQENITDQEELLLLAETELVQGGEEQLWELFLPLSPLLPANISQLYCATHLRKTTNTVGLRHPKLKKLCLPIYQF